MKKMIFVLLAVTSSMSFGQQEFQFQNLPLNYMRDQMFYVNNIVGRGRSYEGSPYLNDKFVPGRLITADKSYPSLLRYNAYADVFEIMTGQDKHSEVIKSDDIKIKLGNHDFELKQLPTDETVYLQKLADGNKVELWLQHAVEFEQAEKAVKAYDQDKPARFISSKNYFINKGDGLSALKLKKKDILSIFDKDNGEMKSFIKQQELSFRKESDLIRMIQHYNIL